MGRNRIRDRNRNRNQRPKLSPKMEPLEDNVHILKVDDSTPDKFYIRTQAIQQRYNILEKDLQKVYSSPSLFEAPSKKLSNHGLFIAKEGGFYYRAKFLSLKMPNGFVEAFFIDEGRRSKVQFEDCYAIDDRFANVSQLCIQVHLPVVPVEETWSAECLNWFRDKIIQISGMAIFRNREIDMKESSCGIDIYWKDSILESPFHPSKEITYFLSQVLVQKQFAKCLEVDVGGIDDGINGTTVSQSSACSSSNNFSINPDHYDAGVEDANTTENEEDEEEISGPVKKWLIPENLNLTTRTRVCVGEVDDVGQIHFMLKSDRITFRQMRDALKVYYNHTTPDMDHCWESGEAAIVRFYHQHLEYYGWTRGTIVKILGPDQYRVYLVDLGITTQVTGSNLRVARHFSDVKALSHRAILNGVVPMNCHGDPWKWSQIVGLDDETQQKLNQYIYQNLAWDYTERDNRDVKIKFIEEPSENMPARSKVTLHPRRNKDLSKCTDMCTRLSKLLLVEPGEIEFTNENKESFLAHSGFFTDTYCK